MKYWIFLLALPMLLLGSLAHLASARPQDASASPEQGSTSLGARSQFVIGLQGDRLSVQARNVPWAVVLQELEHQTGVRFRVEGPLHGTLTQEFEALSLEQGLRRLFRNANLVLFYTKKAGEGSAAEPLTAVWLFPKEGSEAKSQDMHSAITKADDADTLSHEEETKSADELAVDEARDERFETLEAFARDGDEEALRNALFDSDEITQKKALELLAARDQQGVIATLLDATQSEQPETRLRALHLLAQTPYVEEKLVLSTLSTALADEDLTVKGGVIEAMAQRESPGTMEALRQVFHDPTPTVRQLVVGSIVPHDQGLLLLQEALSDVNESVRSLAAWKLKQGISNESAGEIERSEETGK
jgi:HEAT repeat protein